MAYLQGDNFVHVEFYYLSASKLWSDKRGGLWWKRGTITYLITNLLSMHQHWMRQGLWRLNIKFIYNVDVYAIAIGLGSWWLTVFKNISAILWRSILLVEETRVPGENHQLVASHWQTLSHKVVSSTPHHEWDSNS